MQIRSKSVRQVVDLGYRASIHNLPAMVPATHTSLKATALMSWVVQKVDKMVARAIKILKTSYNYHKIRWIR